MLRHRSALTTAIYAKVDRDSLRLIARPWPEGEFWGFEKIWRTGDMGYAGPHFGWAAIPDQYTLAAFERLEQADEIIGEYAGSANPD